MQAYEIPGSVGVFIDDLPLLTTAAVRPFVIAVVLHRGAVRPKEVLIAVTPHAPDVDLKVGGWDPINEEWIEDDRTRLELLVDEVLGELVAEGVLRYNEDEDLWVLTSADLPRVISWAAATGGRIPGHLLADLSRQEIARLPDGVV